jgi:peptidoglycan/LPS O-acetylase OafA/YrhL
MAFVTRYASRRDGHADRLDLATKRAGERIKGFDGVRGIAAILVLAHHTLLTDRHLGTVSVYVFFALSGFLIIKSLHEIRGCVDRKAGSAALEFGRFMWRRALRLLPSYYVTLAALCLFFLASGRLFGDVCQYRAYYATFTQNLLVAFVTQKWSAFTQTWSLAVEQQAYLVCGLALLVVPARRHGVALAVLAAASFAACLAAARAPDGGLMFYCLPFNGLVYMLSGGAFAIYGPQALRAVGLGARAGSAVAAVLGLMILAAAFSADGPSFLEWAPGVPNVAANLVLALAASLFLLLLSERQDSRAVRLLEVPLLAALGSISYTFYIIHVPIAHIVSHVFDPAPNFAGKRVALFAIDLLLATSLSALSYAIVERPMARFKGQRRATRDDRRSPATDQTAVAEADAPPRSAPNSGIQALSPP